jgi:hypothetical protein
MITCLFVDVACDLPDRRAGALLFEFTSAAVSWVGQIIPGPAHQDGSRGPQGATVWFCFAPNRYRMILPQCSNVRPLLKAPIINRHPLTKPTGSIRVFGAMDPGKCHDV